MGIRTELGTMKKGTRTYLPPTAYTLSRKEKNILCKFLSEVKVTEGYSWDIRRLVSMKDLKLKSLKTHDWHVIMDYNEILFVCMDEIGEFCLYAWYESENFVCMYESGNF